MSESCNNGPEQLTLGTCATLACLWEATAPKPGNVYRGADFDDLTYADFITSAAVIGPIIECCPKAGVGKTVLTAVEATQRAVKTNTNLGTLLLLAPLAFVEAHIPLKDGIGDILDRLTVHDTHLVYQAIVAANPGGLGKVDQADVSANPPDCTLVEAMKLAEDRDTIAQQFTNGFHDVFEHSASWIEAGVERGWALSEAIVHAQIRLLATIPDSLIARKCGTAIAQETSDRASTILAKSSNENPLKENDLADFDFWLRSDGHQRNPGTTADLIAAGLFVLLREGRLQWPIAFY